MKEDIYKKIVYLFDRYWDEDLSEEEQDLLYDEADNFVSQYSWKEIFPQLFQFLQQNCKTPKDVLNFAHLYWDYGYYEIPILDPYAFLGYFYYRLGFEPGSNDDMEIVDSLATEMLKKSGNSDADLFLNPYYMPESDPQMIAAANRYK